MACTSSSREKGPSSSREDDVSWNETDVDYVRAALLSRSADRVLMLPSTDGEWDLPLLEYKGLLAHDIERFCSDLQAALEIPPSASREPALTPLFELLGSVASADHSDIHSMGFVKLFLVEDSGVRCDLHNILPPRAQWKDHTFVASIVEVGGDSDRATTCRELLPCLQPPHTRLRAIREPRHQPGWLRRARRLLEAEASRNALGAVRRVTIVVMSSTSTVVRADCAKGALYLKSPLSVSVECAVTKTLHKLFPTRTPEVLAVEGGELNAFVTRGFEEPELGPNALRRVALEAGRLHRAAAAHVPALMDAGCPRRGPPELKQAVGSWLSDPLLKEVFRGSRRAEFVELVGVVVAPCDELSRSSVPETLAHGDVAKHNIARAVDGDGLMLFDFEYAYIGHPFCDLTTIAEHLSDEDVDAYLALWAGYAETDDLRRTYDTACMLGWYLRLWKLFDFLRVCDARRINELENYAIDLFDEMYSNYVEAPNKV